MGVLIVVAAVLLGMYAWCSEFSIRFAGYGLQVIGMGFAIWGLLKVREHFRQPLLRHLFVRWLRRFPTWYGIVQLHCGITQNVRAVDEVKADVWRKDNPEDALETRLEGVLINLERIRKEQGSHSTSIDRLKKNIEEHKKKVAEDNKNMEEKIKLDREVLHTGDLLPALVGLTLITIGITMSTLAPELYRLVN